MKPKTKILIVDDELINLEFFGVMLSKLGYEVEQAEDGEMALEKVRSFVPDLIILDNIMPKLSGWEVTRTLKQDEEFSFARRIPIIMFSAMDDIKDKLEGFELGVDDYITKPFNFSEVLARIKTVLRHKDMADQIVQREKRLALSEELSTSLADCVHKIKKPLKDILKEAKKLESGDSPKIPKNVMEFLGRLVSEMEGCVGLVGDTEKQTTEAQARLSSLKEAELSLKDLEEKYRMKDGVHG